MRLVSSFGSHFMHRVPCFHVSGLFCIIFWYWNLHVCISCFIPCHALLEWHLCLRVGPRFTCMCARISSVSFFISWLLMWVWLRSTHVGVSPLCIEYAISFYSIAYALLYRALCMPSHSIVHARLYINCIHACHAYCIVLGIGVSPSTGNEGRFVLRVTERVSIPSHRHSGLSMMEFRFCCVYMCIHFK